jgi:hypothetical protein
MQTGIPWALAVHFTWRHTALRAASPLPLCRLRGIAQPTTIMECRLVTALPDRCNTRWATTPYQNVAGRVFSTTFVDGYVM